MKNPKVVARRPSYRPLFSAIVCGLLLGAAAATGIPGCNGSSIGGNNTTDDGGTGGGGGGGTDDSGTGGGGGGGTDDGGQGAYCNGQGPPISVGDTNGSAGRCTGNIAAAAFRYGMCLCSGLSSGAPIMVDAFDSTQAGPVTQGAGGSVGCNADVNVSNQLSVGGTLQVSGSLNNSGALTVGLDALVGGNFADDQAMTINRNVQAGSDVRCNGKLTIVGSLTYPTGKTLTATNPSIGSTVRAPVTVAKPCDCSAPYDISGYVQQHVTVNDNAAIGLDPAKLTNYAGDQTINLTCGRFYLGRIGGTGTVTINVSGRTALFVGGDINLSSGFNVNVGSSGELDMFIDGGLTSSGALTFGNTAMPARVRLYMGGARNINLSGNTVIGGNIYAPTSALVPSGTLEIYGSMFVSSFNPSAAVKIHHDIAILKAADECSPTSTGGTGGTTTPVPSCQTCSDCGGQACKSNQCGTCTNSSDCCSPLSCVRGKCVFQIG